MAKEQRETVSYEDLVYSNMIQIEAITRLLVGKGIILESELLEEVRALNADNESPKNRTPQRIN